MQHFKEYSKYYNLLYKDKNYIAETEYILDIIKKYNENATKLLDIGCGTGIHANELSKKGFLVTGMDISNTMLSVAKKTYNNIDFVLGDIRDFKLQSKFSIITSLFHVMSYQSTNLDLINAFSSVNKHLEEGGYFIFDCWYGPGVKNDAPKVRVKRFEDENLKVLRIAEPIEDENLNIIDVNFDVFIIDKSNNTVSNLKELHRMRYLFQTEVELLCEKFNLKVIDCFKWMTFDQPSVNDWYAIFIIKK